MNQFFTIARVIAPIFAAVALGLLARNRQLMTAQEVRGLQQFVMKFGLPCIIFNSCLTADIGAESLTSMALVIPSVLIGTFWGFKSQEEPLPLSQSSTALHRPGNRYAGHPPVHDSVWHG